MTVLQTFAGGATAELVRLLLLLSPPTTGQLRRRWCSSSSRMCCLSAAGTDDEGAGEESWPVGKVVMEAYRAQSDQQQQPARGTRRYVRFFGERKTRHCRPGDLLSLATTSAVGELTIFAVCGERRIRTNDTVESGKQILGLEDTKRQWCQKKDITDRCRTRAVGLLIAGFRRFSV